MSLMVIGLSRVGILGVSLVINGEVHRYNNPTQIINIPITDSYILISMASNEFGDCFNVEVSKEIMPCEIYTEDNLLKEYVQITEVIEAIKKSTDHK
jgi:hypothetical protein